MKYLSYFLIVIGAIVAFYAENIKNQYLLIGGIMLLMIGTYRLSKTIPSRKANEDEEINTNDEV